MFRKVIGQKPGGATDTDESSPELPAASPASTSSSSAPPVRSAPPSPSSPAAASSPAPAAAQRPPTASRNVLSSDVEIKGTVKFTNDLVVDGKIEGEIQSSGNLTVGENARLKAEISTATVVVYGKVHGNITATDRVELKASAEVVGDIKAKVLSIEPGAIFVGKSTVGTPSTPAAVANQKSSGGGGGQSSGGGGQQSKGG